MKNSVDITPHKTSAELSKIYPSTYSIETQDFTARVESDGGTVVDKNYIDQSFKWLKDRGLETSNSWWWSRFFAYKVNASNEIEKIYDLFGHDLIVNTNEYDPPHLYNGFFVFASTYSSNNQFITANEQGLETIDNVLVNTNNNLAFIVKKFELTSLSVPAFQRDADTFALGGKVDGDNYRGRYTFSTSTNNRGTDRFTPQSEMHLELASMEATSQVSNNWKLQINDDTKLEDTFNSSGDYAKSDSGKFKVGINALTAPNRGMHGGVEEICIIDINDYTYTETERVSLRDHINNQNNVFVKSIPDLSNSRLIAFWGQSNMNGAGGTLDFANNKTPKINTCYEYRSDDTLRHLSDPTEGAASGSMIPGFCKDLYNNIQNYVVFTKYAVGGTSTTQNRGESGSWDPDFGTLYGEATSELSGAEAKTGTNVSEIVWCQGEADILDIDSGEITKQEHLDAFRNFLDQVFVDYPNLNEFLIIMPPTWEGNTRDSATTDVYDNYSIVEGEYSKVRIVVDDTRRLAVQDSSEWYTKPDDTIHINIKALNRIAETAAKNFYNNTLESLDLN